MTIGIQSVDDVPEQPTTGGEKDEAYWLGVARSAYTTSTDYFDANIRKQIEKNVYAFGSKHAPGSKYNSDQYKYRSKIFRPKVRAAIRKASASCGVAFFSTADAISITPNNPGDPRQEASAAINQELMNYRLDKSIPWFLTVMGAFVDAKVQGVCISKQFWSYRESAPPMQEDGLLSQQHGEIMEDKPVIELIPAENFRFSASCDWTDPVGSSPFLIHLKKVFVGDIKQRMADGEWITHTEAEVLSASEAGQTTTNQVRQNNRSDEQQRYANKNFDVAWVREYVVRDSGEDYVFMTLGDKILLTEPRPLKELYHTGKRPFVIGYIDIEPHKAYPSGSPELAEGLQIQANDIANQRIDNVRLTLNKRYFGIRNRLVDWDMLRRSVPGGIVLMDTFDSVKAEEMQDVTGSAYAEQDRINTDIDEIFGLFSPSTVSTNRQLNETVGGMHLLNEGANALSEYELRIFSETWVEPVLRQLLLLEQAYENDATVINIAGQKADLYDKFGIDQITDELLSAELTCRVNVGFGATSPQQRIQRMAMGLSTISNFSPQSMARVNEDAIIEEVMGSLGYKDGARFFKEAEENSGVPPEIQQQIQDLQAELEQLKSGIEVAKIRAQAQIEAARIGAQATLEGKNMELEAKIRQSEMDQMTKANVEHIKGEYATQIAQMKGQLEGVHAQIAAADSETKRGELRLEANALQFQISNHEKEIDRRVAELNQGNGSQVIMNDDYGKVPNAIG